MDQRWEERDALAAARPVEAPERLKEPTAPPKAPPTSPLRPERPLGRVVGSWRDAELLAAEEMQRRGFLDAAITGAGADGGIDVIGAGLVGQVKRHANPVGQPPIRDLAGVAATRGARGVFFSSSGYTRSALSFADSAGVALFQYANGTGAVRPANEIAATLHAGPVDAELARRVASMKSKAVALEAKCRTLDNRRLMRRDSANATRARKARRSGELIKQARRELRDGARLPLLAPDREASLRTAQRLLRQAERLL